jgi:hypothetical protein
LALTGLRWSRFGRPVVGWSVPRRLLNRWQPECIREFRAAAQQRYNDGLALVGQRRRTGAIYLWGYSAEMALKAAYFSITLADTDPITWHGHIRPAITRGQNVHTITWPNNGAGHNVRAWAELLVAERATIVGRAYLADDARQIQAQGQRIGLLWNETLRYHKNVAYPYEVTQVRLSAEWLLANLETL